MIPTSKRGFWELLMRSVMESERLSPRLLTVFATVLLTGYLEVKVIQMMLLETPPTEARLLVAVQIIMANIGLITLLLGLGKVTDAFTKVKLEGPPPAPANQITTDQATITGGPVNVTPNGQSPLQGE